MKLKNLICHKIEADLLQERFWIVDRAICHKISILNQVLLKLELKIHNNVKILPHFEDQEIIKMAIGQGLGQEKEKEPDGIMLTLMKANRIIHSELDLNLNQEMLSLNLNQEKLSKILLYVMVVLNNKKQESQD